MGAGSPPRFASMPENDPLILYYTRFFNWQVDIAALPDCGARGRWTVDQRLLPVADAVVCHVPNSREICDARKYPGQLWVAWSQESRVNYPRMADPGFMRHFDLTMSYEIGADIWMPYLPIASWWEAARTSPMAPKTEAASVVHFQSSRIDHSGRGRFTQELSRHIGFDGYGKAYHNRMLEQDLGQRSKLETIARYRFCLALENSIAPDYVTEKMFDPLLAGTVPIYLGAPNVADFVPPGSYIDATAFGGPAELASYLRHLERTPEDYDAYFAWRSRPLPAPLVQRLRGLESPPECRLMDRIRQHVETRADRSGRSSLPFGYLAFARARLARLRRHARRR